jgi:hypothetical protein
LQSIRQFQLEQSLQSSPMVLRPLQLLHLQRQLLPHLLLRLLPHLRQLHRYLHLQLRQLLLLLLQLQHLPEQLLRCQHLARVLAKELLRAG